MLIGSETVRFSCLAMMAICNSPWYHSIVVTFLAFLLNTVCWGFSNPIWQAMFIDITSPDERKFVYALNYWTWNLSMVVGGLVGGFLFHSHPFLVLCLVALGAGASVLILLGFIRETLGERTTSHPPRRFLSAYLNVLNDRQFVQVVLGSLFTWGLWSQVQSYVAVRLARIVPTTHISIFQHLAFTLDGIRLFGILIAENAVLVVLLGLFALNRSQHRHPHRIMFLGLILYVLAFSGLGIFTNPFIVITCGALGTVGEVMYNPISQTLLSNVIPLEMAASYMAVYGLAEQGSGLIGALSLAISPALNSWLMDCVMLFGGLLGISLYFLGTRKVSTPAIE
jgi:DHA1 family multidrug resistance protein B-like MFS transporter